MENRIAALRKARRISQAELAEAVSVTRQTIISLESGCQRQFEIVRKRRRNFVVFRRGGGNKTKRFLAQKECSRFAVSDA